MTAPAPTRTDVRRTPWTYTAAMAKRRIVSIRNARATLKDRIDGAQYRDEHSILMRRSDVAGVIVPPNWYRDACQALGDPWEDWEPPEGSGRS